jgi:hypothetical protein
MFFQNVLNVIFTTIKNKLSEDNIDLMEKGLLNLHTKPLIDDTIKLYSVVVQN